jgi:hypothetical protein
MYHHARMPNLQSGEGLFDTARALLSKAKGAAGKAADFASGDFVTGARNAVGKTMSAVAGAPPNQVFKGEKHAVVLSGPLPKGTNYNWAGPGTQIDRRLAMGAQSAPINGIDAVSKIHYLAYNGAKSAKDVRRADEVFMAGVRRHRKDDPKVAAIALAAFHAKEAAEDAGQLDPMAFAAPQIGGRLLKEAKRIRKKQLAFA